MEVDAVLLNCTRDSLKVRRTLPLTTNSTLYVADTFPVHVTKLHGKITLALSASGMVRKNSREAAGEIRGGKSAAVRSRLGSLPSRFAIRTWLEAARTFAIFSTGARKR